MDRASLESLINDIYESGRKKGVEEAISVTDDLTVSKQESHTDDSTDNHYTLDLRVLEKNIQKVKGIGAKRTEEVMVVIEQWLGVVDELHSEIKRSVSSDNAYNKVTKA